MRDGFPNSHSEFDGVPARREAVRPKGRWSRRFTVLTVVALTAVALALLMHLPRELVALAENRERVRQLQEENNDLSKRLNERRERLKNLKENFNEQELEIRRNLHLYKPGDTVFFLPPKADSTAAPAEPAKD